MMYALCVLADRVARLRDRQRRGEQAAHARAAAETVRQRRASLRAQGRRLSAAERARHAATVAEVLPRQAARILAEPAWEALAAALHTVEAGGADPREALRTVARWRALYTAPSAAGVLVWRLRRLGVLGSASSGDAAGPTSPVRRRLRLFPRTPTGWPGRRPTR